MVNTPKRKFKDEVTLGAKRVYNATKETCDYLIPKVNNFSARTASNVQDLFAVKTNPETIAEDIQETFRPPKRRRFQRPGRIDWNNLSLR
jgi:hypothetical protein